MKERCVDCPSCNRLTCSWCEALHYRHTEDVTFCTSCLTRPYDFCKSGLSDPSKDYRHNENQGNLLDATLHNLESHGAHKFRKCGAYSHAIRHVLNPSVQGDANLRTCIIDDPNGWAIRTNEESTRGNTSKAF